MLRIIRTIICLAVISTFAAAQTPNGHRAQGYVFGGVGGIAPNGEGSTLQLGVGGEGLIYKGLGAGGEIGYLASANNFVNGFGIFSANGSYHFVNASEGGRFVPFATGGYSFLFRSGGHANGFNFGGGINYWIRERMGLRVEFRDQVIPDGQARHFLGVRVGLSFR
jgi:hypothetical protein